MAARAASYLNTIYLLSMAAKAASSKALYRCDLSVALSLKGPRRNRVAVLSVFAPTPYPFLIEGAFTIVYGATSSLSMRKPLPRYRIVINYGRSPCPDVEMLRVHRL